MSTSTTSPLSALTNAEALLVAQINAAADRLDAVGTGNLGAAIDRLNASADAAAARIRMAYAKVQSVTASVLATINEAASLLAQQLAPVPVPPAVEPARVAVVPPVAPSTPSAPVAPVQPAEVEAPSTPAAHSATCPLCGFAPRRGETVCRTCTATPEVEETFTHEELVRMGNLGAPVPERPTPAPTRPASNGKARRKGAPLAGVNGTVST